MCLFWASGRAARCAVAWFSHDRWSSLTVVLCCVLVCYGVVCCLDSAVRQGDLKAVAALLPSDVHVRGDTVSPRTLTRFAGPVEDLPLEWRAVITLNHRRRAPRDLARTVPLVRLLTDAEAELAHRQRLAAPLRPALDVGRAVPPNQAPAALDRTWASSSSRPSSRDGPLSGRRSGGAAQRRGHSRSLKKLNGRHMGGGTGVGMPGSRSTGALAHGSQQRW